MNIWQDSNNTDKTINSTTVRENLKLLFEDEAIAYLNRIYEDNKELFDKGFQDQIVYGESRYKIDTDTYDESKVLGKHQIKYGLNLEDENS